MYQNIPMLDYKDSINNITNVSISTDTYSELLTPTQRHWHNYYEINIVISGNGTHSLNGKDHKISVGNIFFTNPTDIHKIEPVGDDDLVLISLHFTDNAINDKYRFLLDSSYHTIQLTNDEIAKIKIYADSIDKANAVITDISKNEVEIDIVRLNFELILLTIAKYFDSKEKQRDNKVVQVIKYINMHFREQLSLDVIAQQFNYTPSYFSTWFKYNMDCSYTEYLNSLRISYAISLLNKGFSVTDSCFSSGFGSLSRFNRCFKLKTGKSPREYLKSTAAN